MKEISLHIEFNKWLNSHLNSRGIISNMINQDRYATIVLDFNNIDFISRATAHEILHQKELFTKTGCQVTFSNLNKDIDKMLKIVADSMKNGFKKESTLNRLKFNSQEEMDSYILAI